MSTSSGITTEKVVPDDVAMIIPVKKLRVLILVLTSGHLKLLQRAVSSVTEGQLPEPRMEVTVRVVVNTKKPGYAEEVRAAYPSTGAIEVVETESNGFPGKGHNSQIEEFRKSQSSFDYATFLDGDDAYYPPALQLFYKMFDSGVEIGGLTTNDKVMGPWDPEFEGCTGLEARFGLRTFGDAETHWWRQAPRLNPFKNPVFKCSTPMRLLFMSARVLTLAVQVKYCERAELFDDFLAYLYVLEIWRQKLADVRFLACTYLYCYTTLNEDNATHAYVRNQKQDSEERIFREVTTGKFDTLAEDWAADPALTSKTSFFHIGKPHNYALEQKREFAMSKFVVPAVNEWFLEANKLFVAGEFAAALPIYEKLRHTGLQLDTTAMNAGVCNYHTGKIAEAIQCWLDVPVHKRNANLHKNMGVAMGLFGGASQKYAVHYLECSLQQDANQPNIAAELARLKK